MEIQENSNVFLNAIYKEEGSADVYELVISDSQFQNVRLKRVLMEELQHTLTQKVNRDYEIENQYLKCASTVPTLPKNNIIREMTGEESQVVAVDGTLAAFFLEGIQNDYRFFTEREEAPHLVSMKNTIFSESTMTVMFRVVQGAMCWNEILVHMEDGVLQQGEAMFASREELGSTYTKIKEVPWCGEVWFVYQIPKLSLLCNFDVIPPCLLNKACCESVRNKVIIHALELYADMLYRVLDGNPHATPEYVGAGKSYASHYGIYLTCSNSKITTARLATLVRLAIMEYGTNCATEEEFLNKVQEEITNVTERFVVYIVWSIEVQNLPPARTLETSLRTKDEYQLQKVYADLFLYQARVFSYLTHTPLVSSMHPVLYGSDEIGTTVVNGGFKYEL